MNDQVNKTIECTVSNCKFHQNGDLCTASSIKVERGKENMMECADCRTFSPMSAECGFSSSGC